MLVRHVFAVGLLAAIGCQSSSPPADFNCSVSEIAEWEIPAGSLDRLLTPEQAHNQILTGNLPIDGIRDRWEELADRWQIGDQYWTYTLEAEQLINGIGGQEGVVLIRGCQQLGHVATSIGLAEDSPFRLSVHPELHEMSRTFTTLLPPLRSARAIARIME